MQQNTEGFKWYSFHLTVQDVSGKNPEIVAWLGINFSEDEILQSTFCPLFGESIYSILSYSNEWQFFKRTCEVHNLNL